MGNGKESSWGTYCGSAAVVNGKNVGSCLGDLFSISWMEDADAGSLSTETLKTQIERVTARTNRSHVTVFGDTSFESEAIGKFETITAPREPAASTGVQNDADVRDLPLKQAYWLWEHAESEEAKAVAAQEMERIVIGRLQDEAVFRRIVDAACKDVSWLQCNQQLANGQSALVDTACHLQLTRTIHNDCPRRADHNAGGWNAFNMKFSQTLVNICESKGALGKSVEQLDAITRAACDTNGDVASDIVV